MARVTIKGQVTIPKKLRDRFGITPDSDVRFEEQGDKLVLVKQRPPSAVSNLRGKLRRLPFGKNVDDYLGATRGR